MSDESVIRIPFLPRLKFRNAQHARQILVKSCSRCSHVFPLEDFPANSTTRTGKQPYCKWCNHNKVRSSRGQGTVEDGWLCCTYCEQWVPLGQGCQSEHCPGDTYLTWQELADITQDLLRLMAKFEP